MLGRASSRPLGPLARIDAVAINSRAADQRCDLHCSFFHMVDATPPTNIGDTI